MSANFYNFPFIIVWKFSFTTPPITLFLIFNQPSYAGLPEIDTPFLEFASGGNVPFSFNNTTKLNIKKKKKKESKRN